MTEPNFQLLPTESQLVALKQAIQQVTTGMIEQDQANQNQHPNVFNEILKAVHEATTQAAYDNSHQKQGRGKRGCISDAARLIGVNRATLATRVNRFEIKLTPMDEDIPH